MNVGELESRNYNEYRNKKEYSIFTTSPLAPFWLLWLLIYRRPQNAMI